AKAKRPVKSRKHVAKATPPKSAHLRIRKSNSPLSLTGTTPLSQPTVNAHATKQEYPAISHKGKSTKPSSGSPAKSLFLVAAVSTTFFVARSISEATP